MTVKFKKNDLAYRTSAPDNIYRVEWVGDHMFAGVDSMGNRNAWTDSPKWMKYENPCGMVEEEASHGPRSSLIAPTEVEWKKGDILRFRDIHNPSSAYVVRFEGYTDNNSYFSATDLVHGGTFDYYLRNSSLPDHQAWEVV